MGGAMGIPEKLAQYNATTKLGLQSLSHVLITPLRRPWPRNRPIQPLRGSGVHRSDSTFGSLRRTRAEARRSAPWRKQAQQFSRLIRVNTPR